MDILILGKNWPEPNSSAAGSRMLELIEALQQLGSITFASPAGQSEYAADLNQIHVDCRSVAINDSSFDDFLKEIQPDIVVFDRFMTEEQFGWRVAQYCPVALRILDTEDLHGLRQARKIAVSAGRDFQSTDLANEVAVREIAAIYRCDLSLIISRVEIDYLTGFFGVPNSLLHYLPFMLKAPESGEISDLPTIDNRKGFVTIGNFLHAPNTDAVQYLHNEIWPMIRKELPDAEMNVFGAYLPEKMKKLHDPEKGFLMHGRAEDAAAVVKKSRVFLAPLRFGAGLKGKLALAMQCGTPSVTTPIGAEGMDSAGDWCGSVVDSPDEFARSAVALYKDEERWKEHAGRGMEILKNEFDGKIHAPKFLNRIRVLLQDLDAHRLKNFTGRILHHQSMRSTEFMSRWIEEKNKNTY